MLTCSTAHRDAAERGASAVEFAILLPIFIMLVFGGIYGGIAIDHRIGITQAAREGARFGSTLPIPSTGVSDWLSQVMTATEGAATGDITPGSDNATICVAFVDPTGTTLRETLGTDGAVSAPVSGSCFADASLGKTQRVQVSISRSVIFDIGVAQWGLPITSNTVLQYERTKQ